MAARPAQPHSRARAPCFLSFCEKKKVVETLPKTATKAEFAKILRKRRSYVTQLGKEDRLVMKGRRVLVRESIERIEATRDPSKQGVADRHAAKRDGDKAPSSDNTTTPAPDADPEDDDSVRATAGYQHWKERTERAKALQAERENAKAEGKLLDASLVGGAAESAGAAFRSATENLILEIAPTLADLRDESEISALMAQHFHEALERLAHDLANMSRQD